MGASGPRLEKRGKRWVLGPPRGKLAKNGPKIGKMARRPSSVATLPYLGVILFHFPGEAGVLFLGLSDIDFLPGTPARKGSL